MNQRLFLLINGWAGKNSLLDASMVFSAKYLIYIVFLTVAALMLILLYKRQWQPVFWFGGALVSSVVFLLIAAHLYVDHRPFVDHHVTQLIAHAAGKSFPSDHTTATAAMAFGLLLLTPFRKIGVLVLAAAVLIGFSRIFVGVHYPVDILGGIVTGALGGLVVWFVRNAVRNHRQPQSASKSEIPADSTE